MTVTVGDGTVTREAHVTVTVYDVAPDVDAGEDKSGIEGGPVAIEASFADSGRKRQLAEELDASLASGQVWGGGR